MENQELIPSDSVEPKVEQERSVPLSSNFTLFWRIFMPVFGTVFLTAFLGVFFLLEEEEAFLPFVPVWSERILIFVIAAGWFWILWRTLLRFKRIDADSRYLFITNYWVAVRYPWDDVARIEIKKRLGRRVANLYLKAPGRFGQKISFLPASHMVEWLGEKSKMDLLTQS